VALNPCRVHQLPHRNPFRNGGVFCCPVSRQNGGIFGGIERPALREAFPLRSSPQCAPDWKVSDLDTEEIHQMVEDAIQKKRLSPTMSGEKTETILRRLKLVTEEGATRAAAIVFGREEGPGYPMGSIRLARFRDNRQFEGNAFALLKHADKFLDDYIPIASFGCFERVGEIRSSSVLTARVETTGRKEGSRHQRERQSYDLSLSDQVISVPFHRIAPIAPLSRQSRQSRTASKGHWGGISCGFRIEWQEYDCPKVTKAL